MGFWISPRAFHRCWMALIFFTANLQSSVINAFITHLSRFQPAAESRTRSPRCFVTVNEAITASADVSLLSDVDRNHARFEFVTSLLLAGYSFEAYNDPGHGKISARFDDVKLTYPSTDFSRRCFDGILLVTLEKGSVKYDEALVEKILTGSEADPYVYISSCLQAHTSTNILFKSEQATSDDLCGVYQGDSVLDSVRSTVQSNKAKPSWQETHFLFVKDADRTDIEFSVYDQQQYSEDVFVGSGLLTMQDILAATGDSDGSSTVDSTDAASSEQGTALPPPLKLPIPLYTDTPFNKNYGVDDTETVKGARGMDTGKRERTGTLLVSVQYIPWFVSTPLGRDTRPAGVGIVREGVDGVEREREGGGGVDRNQERHQSAAAADPNSATMSMTGVPPTEGHGVGLGSDVKSFDKANAGRPARNIAAAVASAVRLGEPVMERITTATGETIGGSYLEGIDREEDAHSTLTSTADVQSRATNGKGSNDGESHSGTGFDKGKISTMANKASKNLDTASPDKQQRTVGRSSSSRSHMRPKLPKGASGPGASWARLLRQVLEQQGVQLRVSDDSPLYEAFQPSKQVDQNVPGQAQVIKESPIGFIEGSRQRLKEQEAVSHDDLFGDGRVGASGDGVDGFHRVQVDCSSSVGGSGGRGANPQCRIPNVFVPGNMSKALLEGLADGNLHQVCAIDCTGTDTQVMIWADIDRKVIIFAFRGTEKIQDFLIDMDFFQAPFIDPKSLTPEDAVKFQRFMDVNVHKGFLKAYKSVQGAILQQLMFIFTAEVADRNCTRIGDHDLDGGASGWEIFCTGHSLGGALATILSFDLTRMALGYIPSSSMRPLNTDTRGMVTQEAVDTKQVFVAANATTVASTELEPSKDKSKATNGKLSSFLNWASRLPRSQSQSQAKQSNSTNPRHSRTLREEAPRHHRRYGHFASLVAQSRSRDSTPSYMHDTLFQGCLRKSRIRAYTYGSPRVGNAQFARLYDQIVPHCFRVVNQRDVVARLPRSSKSGFLVRYEHAGRTVLINEGGKWLGRPRQSSTFTPSSPTAEQQKPPKQSKKQSAAHGDEQSVKQSERARESHAVPVAPAVLLSAPPSLTSNEREDMRGVGTVNTYRMPPSDAERQRNRSIDSLLWIEGESEGVCPLEDVALLSPSSPLLTAWKNTFEQNLRLVQGMSKVTSLAQAMVAQAQLSGLPNLAIMGVGTNATRLPQ